VRKKVIEPDLGQEFTLPHFKSPVHQISAEEYHDFRVRCLMNVRTGREESRKVVAGKKQGRLSMKKKLRTPGYGGIGCGSQAGKE